MTQATRHFNIHRGASRHYRMLHLLLDILMHKRFHARIGGLAALLHFSATAAPLPPDWQITRNETDWVSAQALFPGLILEGERVSVLLDSWDTQPPPAASTPRLWRWTMDPHADQPVLSSTVQPFQVLKGSVTATPSGYFATRTTLDSLGPEGDCGWISLDASLQPRWSQIADTSGLQEPGICRSRAVLSDGGAVVLAPHALRHIDATGTLRWELPWAALGTNIVRARLRLAAEADHTLVVVSTQPDTRAWVLDLATGAIRSQLDLPRPVIQVLAERHASSGLELLVSSILEPGSETMEFRVLRVPAGQATLETTPLAQGSVAFGYPHDQGFALVEIDRIRVFDGVHPRWTQPLSLAGPLPHLVAVNAEGAVAVAESGQIRRYAPDGVAQPPVPWNVQDGQSFSMVMSTEGVVWILQHLPLSSTTSNDVMVRIPARSNAPDLQVPVRIPARTSRAGALHVQTDGMVQALLWRHAPAMTSTTGEWLHLEVDPSGEVRAETRWPGPAPYQVRRIGSSWALLSRTSFGYQLNVWNPATGELRQQSASLDARMICDVTQCALAEPYSSGGPRLTRFDDQGTLQVLQDRITPILCHGPESLRGLRVSFDGHSELLEFTANAPETLMSLAGDGSPLLCQGSDLLTFDANGVLQRRGASGIVWSTPLPYPSSLLQRDTLLYSAAGSPINPAHMDLNQIDPDTGLILRQWMLPFLFQSSETRQISLETIDERLIWVTEPQSSLLHAVHRDGRIDSFASSTTPFHEQRLQALPGDRVVVLYHGSVAAYSASLFRDGLEDE